MKPFFIHNGFKKVFFSVFSRAKGLATKLYYLYTNSSFRDVVSKQLITTTLAADRPLTVNGVYTEFAENEPTINEDGLNTYGGYSQLVPKSEDTSTTWAGAGPWTQSITLANTGVYTVSTDLSGATVTITAGTATIDASASATYGTPDQFEVTGAGTVTISTDIANPKAQLTLSAYVLPYAKNATTGTLSVADNYSDAIGGYKYPIGDGSTLGDNLLDAFDGVADGVVTLDDDFSTDTSGDYGSTDSTISYDSASDLLKVLYTTTVAGKGLYYFDIGTVNKKQKVTFRARGTRATPVAVILGVLPTERDTNPVLTTSWQDYEFRATPIDGYLKIYFNLGEIGDYVEFDDILIQEISDAQGEIQFDWTPTFDAADVSGVVNILTGNDETSSFLFYNGATQEIHAHDGTNTAVVACVPVAGTTYAVKLICGDNSGQKMGVVVDSTVGTLVTNAGRFETGGDYLSVGWESDPWQAIKNLKIFKEPVSW